MKSITVSSAPVLLGLGFLLVATAATPVAASSTTDTSIPSPSAAAPPPFSLVAGQVLRDGQPVAEADVLVVAWPQEDPQRPFATGERVPTVRVPAGRTDASGRFTARLDPAKLNDHFAPNSFVDFELVVGDSTSEASWWFSAMQRGRAWATGKTAKGVVAAESVAIDLGAGTAKSAHDADDVIVDAAGEEVSADAAGATTGAGATGKVAVQQRGGRLPRSSDAAAGDFNAAATGCIESAGTWHYGRPERFANVYAWSGAKATVTSTYGSTHSLGVAVKSTSGVWSASGSSEKSLAASSERTGVADAAIYNKINYRDYTMYNCSGYYTGTARRPISVNALHTAFTYVSHVSYYSSTVGRCTTYTGGTHTKDRGANLSFATGVDLSVINVSSNARFDRGVKVSWPVTSRTRLCGSSDVGWVSSANASASQG